MNEEITIYRASDIQRIFNVGKTSAYGIMHLPGFPSFSIGTQIFVEKRELEKWVQRNRNKRINI